MLPALPGLRSLCALGLTPVQTLGDLALGSIRNVFAAAHAPGAQRSILFHHLLVAVRQKLERQAILGRKTACGYRPNPTLTPRITALAWSYLARSRWKIVGLDGAALRHILG